MSAVAAIAPKLAVFLVAVVIGGAVMLTATIGLGRSGPVSGASEAPDFQLLPEDGGSPIAFDVADAAGPTIEVVGLPPADLVVATETIKGGEPVAGWINPSGFPRIPPVSQWDDGPFANANCTLAAGAMLARLGWGIVTSGSALRTLQDDQVGGTGLDDLQVALSRGYGVTPRSGGVRPSQLKDLLAAGYGAVVQGVYGEIPRALRLQSDFVGPHAIFIDGYYPGDGDIPPAYFVIDPLAHRSGRYEGDWWPASIVDAFGLALGSGGRISAAWTFPVGGGPPPEVVGPDVLPIPPSGGDSPAPGASPDLGVPEPPAEAGDVAPFSPVVDVTVSLPPAIGAIGLNPYLVLCLFAPVPAGCPSGVPATFEVDVGDLAGLQTGPDVEVLGVDSDQPNAAFIYFRIEPPGPANVRFWEADGTPAVVREASWITELDLPSGHTFMARLDVLASTTYRYQVIAGDGIVAAVSPLGEFTTATGVSLFEIDTALIGSPVLGLERGLSPYTRLALGGLARPLELSGPGGGCALSADYDGVTYCLPDTGHSPVRHPTDAGKPPSTMHSMGSRQMGFSSGHSRPSRACWSAAA